MIAPLILIFLSTAYADVTFDSKCPDVKPVDDFNFAEYGKGVWYEVARYPNEIQKDIKCARGVNSLKEDYISVQSFLVKNNQQLEVELIIRKAQDAGNSGKLISSISNANMKIESLYNVLDIDYDNYAIAYSCRYNEEKKSRQDNALIISRSKILSADIKAKVEKFIKASEFLDYDKFIWPETSCDV